MLFMVVAPVIGGVVAGWVDYPVSRGVGIGIAVGASPFGLAILYVLAADMYEGFRKK